MDGRGVGGSPRGTERNSGTNSDNNPERALSICYSGRQSLDAGDIDQRAGENETYEYEDGALIMMMMMMMMMMTTMINGNMSLPSK